MIAHPQQSRSAAARSLTNQAPEPSRRRLPAMLPALAIATGTRTIPRRTIVPAVILRRTSSLRNNAPSFQRTSRTFLGTGPANGPGGFRSSSTTNQRIIAKQRTRNSCARPVTSVSNNRRLWTFPTCRLQLAPAASVISSPQSPALKRKDNDPESREGKNACTGCHTKMIGSLPPPCSHYLLFGDTYFKPEDYPKS